MRVYRLQVGGGVAGGAVDGVAEVEHRGTPRIVPGGDRPLQLAGTIAAVPCPAPEGAFLAYWMSYAQR